MVKLGFLVEGATEKIILEKSDFFNYLYSLKIEAVEEVEDAKGNGNLLPQNIKEYIENLTSKGATTIFILTDLDEDKCITETKARISAESNHIVIVSVKEIESWFLSDTTAIGKLIGNESYFCPNPELINKPFEEIRSIRINTVGRGIRTKKILAETMVRNGFSILKAAEHPNCNSAKYFLSKIKALVNQATL